MELEELTKTQIILLVILVSFVTSIATGIVTVSLLAQAPPAVIQTVNHIIERTVESVTAPVTSTAAAVTHETTIVVKEDDLVTTSIADSFVKVGHIHTDVATSSPIAALGSLIGGGHLVTDAVVDPSVPHVVDFGNATYTYMVSSQFPEMGISLMVASGTPPSIPVFKSADVASLKLGQTIVALYGSVEGRVGMSTVSGVSPLTVLTIRGGDVAVRTVDTTLDRDLTPGAPLINIFGDLVGISTSVSRGEEHGSFVSMSDILAAVSAAEKPAATSTPARQ